MKNEAFFLWFGDMCVLYASLFLALFFRHFSFPEPSFFLLHLLPFTLIFLLNTLIYFIIGLYEQHTVFLRKRIPFLVFYAQTFASIGALSFFFFIPFFGITPKTILFLFLFFSFLGITLWRIIYIRYSAFFKTKKHTVLFIGGSEESKELLEELKNNPRYNMYIPLSLSAQEIVYSKDFLKQMRTFVEKKKISGVIIDTFDTHLQKFSETIHHLLVEGSISFAYDTKSLYETIFRRIPVESLDAKWFFISYKKHPRYSLYFFLSRFLDIFFGSLCFFIFLLCIPFVFLGNRFTKDNGPLYVEQERVGEKGKLFYMKKFRTMNGSDKGKSFLNSTLKITPFGAFLRKARIDELPQSINVLKGDLSFVGPRPELPDLFSVYEKEIPYYTARNLLRPGLTGWAQIYHNAHPHHKIDIKETKNKLSYDFYYLKHRSFFLDIEIILKTIKKILLRNGA
jgi:lipopolysaccharide/colanic/teichoic acid biosynthesis glycosyltransferase